MNLDISYPNIFVATAIIIIILITFSIINFGKVGSTEIINITIDDNQKQKVVDYPGGPIRLFVTGINNEVGVKADTNLIEVDLIGVGNKLYLCESSHSPIIHEGGISNKVIYLEC